MLYVVAKTYTIDDVVGASAIEVGTVGTYTTGHNVWYQVYAFKTVAGTRIYSANVSNTNQVDIANDNVSVSVTIPTVSGAEGYRVLRQFGGITGQEVAGSFTDDGSGWDSQIVTATPSSYSTPAANFNGKVKFNNTVDFNFNTGEPKSVPHPKSVHITGPDTDFAALYLDSFGDNADSGCYRSIINLRAARGTLASPTQTMTDDEVGRVGGRAHTGNAFTGNICAISYCCAEDTTPTHQGGYIDFRTTPIGSTGGGSHLKPYIVARVQSNGAISVGNESFCSTLPPAYTLALTGGEFFLGSVASPVLGTRKEIYILSSNNHLYYWDGSTSLDLSDIGGTIALDDLSDVIVNSGLANNQGLVYDSGDAIWRNIEVLLPDQTTPQTTVGTFNLTSYQFPVTYHYTGFPNKTDTSLAWDDGSYTLTLTASSKYIWLNGVRYSINTLTKQLSVAQEAVSGLYWFWITAPGGVPQLNVSTTSPDIGSDGANAGFDQCNVATVYWNTTTSKGILSDERHWMGRDCWMHEYLHETIGSRYASGMAGTFGNASITIGQGEFYDEDIEHTFTEQTTVKVLYHNGSDEWVWDIVTVPYKISGGNLQYNNGTTLATATLNKFVNYFVFATADTIHPINVVVGTTQYNNLADATAASIPSLGALVSAEVKLIYRVTYKNNGPTWQHTTDYRNVSSLPASGYVATDHGSLSGLSDDDHTQYHLTDGSRAGTGTHTFGNIVDSGLTAGRITFAGTSGLLSDSANFVWDNSNNRLGINGTPTAPLETFNSVVDGVFGTYGIGWRMTKSGSTVTGMYIDVNGTNGPSGLLVRNGTTQSWLYGINNSNFLRIAPMASVNQTGITNAKDGTTGITIDTSGKVGIGVATPAYMLDISGQLQVLLTTGIGFGTGYRNSSWIGGSSGNPAMMLQNGSGKWCFVDLSSGTMEVLNGGNYDLVLGANNSVYVYVKSGGKFGIGASSPSAQLEVTSSGQLALRMNRTVTNGSFRYDFNAVDDPTESQYPGYTAYANLESYLGNTRIPFEFAPGIMAIKTGSAQWAMYVDASQRTYFGTSTEDGSGSRVQVSGDTFTHGSFITQRTDDSTTDGAMWYRTDLDELRFRLDGVTYRANVSPVP
jgi:hypothetical protein